MISFKQANKIALVFTFLLVLTACTRPTGIPASPEVELSQEEDENIDLKLKYFNRNCIDIFSGQINMLHEDYMEAFNDDPELMNEENVPYLFELDSPHNCSIAISKAKELNLAQELDPLAEDFLSALQNAIPVINQASRYYDQMDYKMDDFEKGKELHPELMTAFETFEKADTVFRENIQESQSALNLRFLEKYREEGSDFEFMIQDTWIKGTALINKAEAEGYDTLDLEGFMAAVNDYQATLETLDAYLLEHPQQAYLAQDFQEEAWEFMAEAKALMHRKREDQPYDEFEGNAELMRDEYEWWKDEYFL